MDKREIMTNLVSGWLAGHNGPILINEESFIREGGLIDNLAKEIIKATPECDSPPALTSI